MSEAARYRGDLGVWVLYDHDASAYPISMHFSERKAIEALATLGYGKIAFWPVDTAFKYAISEWWEKGYFD